MPWFWPQIQPGFPGSAIMNWISDSELKSSQLCPYGSRNLAQAHGYCKQTFPHMSIRGKAIPAGDGMMADSMEYTQRDYESGRKGHVLERRGLTTQGWQGTLERKWG